MNDTKEALGLIHESLVEMSRQLLKIQCEIREQAKREERRLEQLEERTDGIERRVRHLEQPVSY